MNVETRSVFRSRNIRGIKVRSTDRHHLGHIRELAIDMQRGQIAYAVLAFGGWFRFKSKLIAVPWDEFTLVHDETDRYLVLDASADILKELPGLDGAQWPQTVNLEWRGRPRTAGRGEQDTAESFHHGPQAA